MKRPAQLELVVVNRASGERDIRAAGTAADQDDNSSRPRGLGRSAPGLRTSDGLEYERVLVEALDASCTELLGLLLPLGMAVGDGHRAALRHKQRAKHQSHRAAAKDPDIIRIDSPCDGVDGRGQRFSHGGSPSRKAVGDDVKGRRRGRYPLGESAQHPPR